GTSGNLSNSTPLSLTITPGPNFSLSASPASLSVGRRGKGTTNITITPSNGFNSSVTLSVSGLPSGVSASFGPNPTTSTSTLTVKPSSRATLGTFTVTITGRSGALTQQTTIGLTIQR